ncbi:hypothetical protein J4760_12065 [Salinicoccus sp. ID82-1]|uniref:hypothetical protein n=1 Tax=Salinicoccus sp. ID82-1 TaxID=2820269 RepID=UPI001F1D9F42|nr:hypothetical protein [Salinicoccus sp. ID82-1]MCG1010755.1 hypothetical protein [Salinicoccus sp. ID82-1]
MKATIVWGNIILCGIIAIFIAFFFAEGTIAENYTNKRFVAPEFFLVVPVWAIGALSASSYFYRSDLKNTSYVVIILISLLLWMTIPAGLWFSSLFLQGK